MALCAHCAELFSPTTELRRIEAETRKGDFFLVCDRSKSQPNSIYDMCAKSITVVDSDQPQEQVDFGLGPRTCHCSEPPCSACVYTSGALSDVGFSCVICRARFYFIWERGEHKYLVILRLQRKEPQSITAVELIFIYPLGLQWKEVINFTSPRSEFLRNNPLCRGALGADSILWTQTMLSRCAGHPECNKLATPGTGGRSMPHRLLMVQQCSDVFRVKLVETVDMSTIPTYFTLSHCWGTSDIACKLTLQNYLSYKDRIPFCDLPRTFQEALIATHQLGEIYLWIDALCIIQDNHEDWAQEAPRMASIYANGLINLAAECSSSPIGGLFNQDRRLVRDQIYLPWRDIPIESRAWAMKTTEDLFSESVSDSALGQRAWVFQEKTLSPRTLHFAQDQLWWECRSQVSNESRGSETVRDPRSSSKAMDSEYSSLVALYAARQLTYNNDRLVAFSAIAQMWASRNQLAPQEYLAGLWKKDLLKQLLWSWYEPAAEVGLSTYSAPSWSWAARGAAGVLRISTNSPLRDKALVNKDVHMLDAEVLYKDEDPYSIALSGYIRLQCVLIRIVIDTGRASVLSIEGRDQEPELSWRWIVRLDHTVGVSTLQCFLLPIAVHVGFEEAQCLLLRPVSECEHTFQRLGFVSWNVDRSKMANADTPITTNSFKTPDGQVLATHGPNGVPEVQTIRII